MSRFKRFDCTRLQLQGLSIRGHDLLWTDLLPLAAPVESLDFRDLPRLVTRILEARRAERPVLLMMGAHPIKLGLSRFLIDLLDRRLVTHLATNGAGLIHDFELALAGGTSEDVAHWLAAGQFGLWHETALLNDAVRQGLAQDEGLGEAIGRFIEEKSFPHRDLSLAASCWRLGVPFTCHVGIGCDITHGMPNCDGAALGRTSHSDFLTFAHTMEELEGGVFLNVGSAVIGPEVFLKALAMARNLACQQGRQIERFATAVFDLVPLPEDFRDGPPAKKDALYYYRPWKTLLVRSVKGAGESFYIQGNHRSTLPALWHRLVGSV